jgi:hypothetical protein
VSGPLFARLIHSFSDKKQRSALGQNSIGRVGQISIGVNSFTAVLAKRRFLSKSHGILFSEGIIFSRLSLGLSLQAAS